MTWWEWWIKVSQEEEKNEIVRRLRKVDSREHECKTRMQCLKMKAVKKIESNDWNKNIILPCTIESHEDMYKQREMEGETGRERKWKRAGC